MTDKRWFVGVMLVSYASFAYFRHKPYPGLQCLFLFALTCILNIWPVNNNVLLNIMPGWFNYLFQDVFVCGLFVWVGCIMVYFVVGYYGHDIVSRILVHPLAQDPKFQRGLVNSAPIIFLAVLFAEMWGPQQTLGMDTERGGYSWKWDPLTVFLDQIVAVGMIFLLSQAVRGIAPWIAPVGACSLGIYLGGDISFFVPHGLQDKLGASFGIIVDRYEILPTLQRCVTWTASFWPAMVVCVFTYTMFQIFIFGVPFHKMYLQLINFCDWCTRKMHKK
jgi:hypothetical protein